jgi:hypothetical protein
VELQRAQVDLFDWLPPFFVAAFWVYDIKKVKSQLITVGILWAIVLASLIVFIPVLNSI